MFLEKPEVAIRRAAMDLLARREHSQKELFAKLSRRFSKFDLSSNSCSDSEFFEPQACQSQPPDLPTLIEAEIARLTDEGLQSDYRLAEAFVRSRFQKGQGPVKIKMELRGKGVADEIISEVIKSPECDWFELVAEVAGKKFGDEELAIDMKARRQRFLSQRGFTYDHIASLE